jgi:hypothetical protein
MSLKITLTETNDMHVYICQRQMGLGEKTSTNPDNAQV